MCVEFRLLMSQLPSVNGFENRIAITHADRRNRDRIPDDIAKPADCSEALAYLVPVIAQRHLFRSAHAGEPGGIGSNCSAVLNVQFDCCGWRHFLGQSGNGLRQTPGVIDVGGVIVADPLHWLAVESDAVPAQGGRNLKNDVLLGRLGVVAHCQAAGHGHDMRRTIDLNVQLIVSDGKRFAIKCPYRRGQCEAEKKRREETRHRTGAAVSLPCATRRWRATSYITIAPATETFSEGTRPYIGIETRKSQRFRTRSCKPFPSAPKTTAQCML